MYIHIIINGSHNSIVSLCIFSTTGFVVVPESKTVHERSMAVFRCRHSDADDITWSVNGISVSVDAPGEINPGFERDRDDNLVDTLSITANSTNNNSHVVCKATIGSQSVSSPPALLTVLPRTSPLSGECVCTYSCETTDYVSYTCMIYVYTCRIYYCSGVTKCRSWCLSSIYVSTY